MILFADTFHCFFFCASLPLFTNVFHPFYSLCSLLWERATKNKAKKREEEERKGNKQRLLVNYVPLALLKSLRRENRRNLIYFHSSCFLLTESWNYKSRDIHAISRISASLQSWGLFYYFKIELNFPPKSCSIYKKLLDHFHCDFKIPK